MCPLTKAFSLSTVQKQKAGTNKKARRFICRRGVYLMIALYLAYTGSRQHVCRVMMVVAMSEGKHFERHASEPLQACQL
jgi:hypothetical protein